MAKRQPTTCIIKGCKAKVHSRGLCRKCWDSAHENIKSGRLTETWLIEKGLLLEKRQCQGGSAFEAAIEAAGEMAESIS